jgi:hypothetical protein
MSLHGNYHVNTYGGFMAKIYEIKTKGESYTFKTYDNGVEYVYDHMNENEMLDMEHDHLMNGFIQLPILFQGE